MDLVSRAGLIAFRTSLALRRSCKLLDRAYQPRFCGPSNEQRKWASAFVGGSQQSSPNQPGQEEQGASNPAEEGDRKGRSGSTLFKMFESAATTFASLVVLG